MSDCQRRYIQMTLDLWFGPVTLTIFSPDDAMWICEQIRQLTYDIRKMRKGLIHVGSDYIALDREISHDEQHFRALALRAETEFYAPPLLEILVHNSMY